MKLRLVKKAQIMGNSTGVVAARTLAGALTGGLTGRYVTPKIMGYEDDPQAVNMSTVLDASLGGIAGHSLPHLGKWMADPSMAVKLMGALGAAELMPVGASMLHSGTRSADNLTEAAKNMKIPPSIAEQLQSALQSPEGRGAGVGAAGAGIAAILSGLLRAKSESEVDNTRGGMVTKDFLKYLIPAMLAGGVAGNIVKKQGTGPKTAL